MPQSPELAGGEGFTFEGDVAAFYLSALLAESYAPGIDDRTVVGVSVQQRDSGEPLDDVIVDFEDIESSPARLSLQVKRSLTISNALTNTDFREIIHDSWQTLQKPDFRTNIDRYGAAVGTISATKERDLKTLCDWARESITVDHFQARFAQDGNASANITDVKDNIVALLEEVGKGSSCTNEEVHQFLAHFVLIQFDFLREGATDPPEAVNRIRDCLAPTEASKAPLLWSKFVQLARTSAGKSGQFDRPRLVRMISPVARMRGAPSLTLDLNKLTEHTRSFARCISDGIGGMKLDRTSLLDDLDEKLNSARVVQIRGLPGSGKSVLVKRAISRVLGNGPVLFLKAEQLAGKNWINYASLQGLSDTPLERLLVEIGAVGTPILFIDAIDRIEKNNQPIILDTISTIAESPLLDNWKVVVSLRDTGIEMLRNWLGNLLDALEVATINVGQLSKEEAEILADAKPHLKPLLFGSHQVKEIVRRPFFAKVLNQSYEANPAASGLVPQSELDLIENWWRWGGYNETGQDAIERRLELLDLASVRAHELSQPIRLNQLTSIAHINDLISDGILQEARAGISVRFAHDIFFEWAFFHVLVDRGIQWIEEIKTCGEPPAVSRVVELVSQWEYSRGKDWTKNLALIENSGVRSQWLRSWLVGPFGTASFEADESQFADAVFTDNFRLFRKALVWFQAEKTSPSTNVLASAIPVEKRHRLAYYLGWPSDFAAWRRLIIFCLGHITDIPQSCYPQIVSIFEVWQNALADYQNPISSSILQQTATWLGAIDAAEITLKPDENSAYWRKIPGLKAFQESLIHILMRSSRAEPTLAAEYLQRVINKEKIRDDLFYNIITYSFILANSLPQLLVDLSVAFLKEELPDEQVAREEEERRTASERRQHILAKPEAKRSRQEQFALDLPPAFIGNFSYHDWERLCIRSGFRNFWPSSPLKEPFHSLFKSSPDEALRLLHELCNHATTAWQQLHRHTYERRGTPIPLELDFPWGKQVFWGNDQEYLWFRSDGAPGIIGCGFMALEEWCFTELNNNRPVDELIRQIVEGNKSIAILGIASMIAIQSEVISDTTFPLFTSQRLLSADHIRMVQDLSLMKNLTGFSDSSDKSHVEAIKSSNSRSIRRKELSSLISRAIITKGSISVQTRDVVISFKNNLPFQYEEERDVPGIQEQLRAQADKFAELVDLNNYQAYHMKEHPDQIAIVHKSPTAAEPENVARAEEASKHLQQMNLWAWASKSLEEKALSDTYTVNNAIIIAKESDRSDLFEQSRQEDREEKLTMCRGAVAATAAIVLNFREGCTEDDLNWARDVLKRGINLQEHPDLMWSPHAVNPWHQAAFAARGLAADLRKDTAGPDTGRILLGLVAHPIDTVSITAFEELCTLWPKDPKLTWIALVLAFSLCHIPPRPSGQPRKHREAFHSPKETNEAINIVLGSYEDRNEWVPLPLPPPAWIKIDTDKDQRWNRSYEDFEWNDATEENEAWSEPETFWRSKHASEMFRRIPFEKILDSSARDALLDFLTGVLDWTIQKNAPSWMKSGQPKRSANDIYEWTHILGSMLGQVAGFLPLVDFKSKFLDQVLGLDDDNCWALLSPFTSTYICSHIYDSPVVPTDAIALLELCLERLLQSASFQQDSYRSGELSGFDQPRLIETMMFVSIEQADMATRYVNGDWSEINHILPLIDRFVRAGGWAASIMDPFLTLCERARADYPAGAFADQVLSIIENGPDKLKGWKETFIPARIADLVQHYAHRDTPMELILAQKFLRILDILVDMGDRRSAALQLSEFFREVRLPP